MTDNRAEQLDKTKRAAFAFLEDFEYLSGLVDKVTPKRGYLRRASVIIRRWLVDGTLQEIASPRVGRIEILAPDTTPFVASGQENPFVIFVNATTSIFGVFIAAAMLAPGNKPREIEGIGDLDEKKPVRIDSFRRQEVIYFKRKWITRDDVIKYIANVADGVHSRRSKSEDEKIIARARHVMTFSLVDPKKDPNRPKEMPEDIGLIPSVNLNQDAVSSANLPLVYSNDSIDCVLVELLAIIRCVIESPDVIDLVEAIRKEAALC